MELQINDLISSIKKDGIEAANAEANAIVENAKRQAAQIIRNAENEAEQIRIKNEKEIAVLKESVKLNAEHTLRDAMLSFKKAVEAEFEKLLSADAGKAVDTQLLAKLIRAAMCDENPSDYAAEVAQVTEGLKSELADEIRNGLEIRPVPNVHTGFRLAAKDGSGYFDCSDEEIVKMLQPFFTELNI